MNILLLSVLAASIRSETYTIRASGFDDQPAAEKHVTGHGTHTKHYQKFACG